MHILIFGKPASKGSRSPFFTVRLGNGDTRPPSGALLSSRCEALPPAAPPGCRTVRVCKWSGEAGLWERVQGKWTVGEGWPDLSWIVVSSCRRLGGAERQG